MARRYDDKRWIQNPDGSFSRRIEKPAIEGAVDYAPPEPEKSDTYYQDISTTGAAAALADELGVDLSTVAGTGKGGRITKGDVEEAAK